MSGLRSVVAMTPSSAIGVARGERVPDVVRLPMRLRPECPRLPRFANVAEQRLDGWDRQRRTRSSATVRTCCAPRARTPGRSTPSCGRCGTPGSRAPRPRSASTRTDASASCSSTARCPVAPYPDWSQSDTRAGVDRQAAARAARRRPPVRWPGSHLERRSGRPGGRDGGLPQRRGARRPTWCSATASPSRCVDFEFAAPGRPVYDLAQLCPTLRADRRSRSTRLGWAGEPADRPARLRLVADAYGLDRAGRAELLSAMDDALDRIEAAGCTQRRRWERERRCAVEPHRWERSLRPQAPMVGRAPRSVRRRSPLTSSSADRGVARMAS